VRIRSRSAFSQMWLRRRLLFGFEILEGFDDRGVVPIDFDGAPDFLDGAVGADDESGAGNPHFLFAVHILLPPRTKFFSDLVVGIGEEREVQFELVTKLDMAIDIVGADAENLRTELFQLAGAIAKRTRFFRAARRIVGRIKIQDNGAAFEISQLHLRAIVGSQSKRWSFRAFFEPVRHFRQSRDQWSRFMGLEDFSTATSGRGFV
jgi:hypothetical protein